jgi:transcriptional regulator with XRE-family HTH domain
MYLYAYMARNAKERVGAIIRSHRKAHGYTQEYLGELVGVSQASISDWETGKTLPSSWRHEGNLARELGFNAAELMAARYTDDPVEQAIWGQPGLTRDASQALVDIYRVLLQHKPA